MYLKSKYDIMKLVQREIDDGDTPALYGMRKTSASSSALAMLYQNKLKEVKSVQVSQEPTSIAEATQEPFVNITAWHEFSSYPSVDCVYEVRMRGIDGVRFSRYNKELGFWCVLNGAAEFAAISHTRSTSLYKNPDLYQWRRIASSPVSQQHAEAIDPAAWHPFTETPEHDGVYEITYLDLEKVHFSMYLNGKWHLASRYERTAHQVLSVSSDIPNGAYSGWRQVQNKES